MVRNLRVPLARARLTEQEVRTFRGVITALSRAAAGCWPSWP
jgi:tRNA/rRNA methyltransferase